jgi:NAD-dependent dihydropyrimidine dehydrogenase PreA subunit
MAMLGLRYLEGVTTHELDPDKCRGCGMCDRDACIECGACQLNCQPGAITVEAGVGCAAAIIQGKLKGTEPTCDCCDGGDTPADDRNN